MKCRHDQIKKFLVTFKNGTDHIEVRCSLCDKYLYYDKKNAEDHSKLQRRETQASKNALLGIPEGCRGCLDNKAKLSGFCNFCESKKLHKAIRPHIKKLKKTIWEVTKDELFEIYSIPEMRQVLCQK